tara:strand:- start:140 stop:733 length:594 start_codon:yes stop_codon:yes gene_type:complete
MKLISFEGIEGVGKSTQIKLLKEYLESNKYTVKTFREPGSSRVGEEIRNILLNNEFILTDTTELLLLFAARTELVNQLKTDEYDYVLLDRYYDASLAYQGYGRGISLDLINSLINSTKCPIPTHTILLDIDVITAFERKKNDTKDRIESAGSEFFEKVRDGYIKIANQNSQRFHIIDAKQDIKTISDTVKNIILNNV